MSEFKKIQGLYLLQAVSASMTETFPQIISPLTPKKYQYNQIETLWTLKWLEIQPKNNSKIKILGSCEWIFNFFRGLPC